MARTHIVALGLAVVSLAIAPGCRVRRSRNGQPAVRLALEVAPSEGDSPRSTETPVDITYATRAREVLTVAAPIATVRCPAGASAASLWGTDIYTDDSSVCAAALHSGLIRGEVGGAVRVVRLGAMPSYRASTRGGVTSTAFGPFAASFAFVNGPAAGIETQPSQPVAAPDSRWTKAARDIPAQSEGLFQHECPPGGVTRTIWGSGIYTEDSSVCVAAVHAGLITFEQGGTVRGFRGRGLARYAGSTRNGVTSSAYGRFAGSFAFDRAAFDTLPRPPAGTTEFSWDEDLSGRRETQALRIRVFCGPDGSADTIWGTDVYTDDSSVCTAAVHAGLITFERGGVFTVETAPGRAQYRGTERNDVESQSFERFERSFRVHR
jgi:hypothetical protein